MATDNTPRINATVTRYEAAPEFPEAAYYAEFCAERLGALYPGYEISVEYGTQTRAFVYGGDADADEVSTMLRVELWDEFCDVGYKAYTDEPSTPARIVTRDSIMTLSVPPACRGQMVERAYGFADDGSGDIYRRVYDRSDRTVAWYVADGSDLAESYDPANGEPEISEWTPVTVTGDRGGAVG